ncbi:hypothetical protein FSP39_015158 [Pinctada imbricata]|uniref:N-acetylgalactosaminide beta-1,3-galactosyltransferase n=1 Tax=Pinctada imbricata TaxID=66713 RepID=A0AA89C1G3_PINIB|nr:hypothetical protein FSP39_015158 [Pinctada imbricata]
MRVRRRLVYRVTLAAAFLSFVYYIEKSRALNLRYVDGFMKRFANSKQSTKKNAKYSRILCFVMTTPSNIATKAMAVNNTWGSRCDKLLFVNAEVITSLPTMVIEVEEGRDHLTKKTYKSLQYLYKHYVDSYDWFLKADDDAYLIMENLRHLLESYNSQNAVYLGHHFRIGTRQGYMSGGGGFLLSAGALKAINEKGYGVEPMCQMDGKDEDLDIGICLDHIGVKTYSSIDKYGRQSFHPFGIIKSLTSSITGGESYYFDRPIKDGPDCCSQLSVSFHYINPVQMYLLEFMLYKSVLHGRHYPIKSKDNFFKPEVATIPNKAANEIILPPKYFWHFLFGRRKYVNSGNRKGSDLYLIVFVIFYQTLVIAR